MSGSQMAEKEERKPFHRGFLTSVHHIVQSKISDSPRGHFQEFKRGHFREFVRGHFEKLKGVTLKVRAGGHFREEFPVISTQNYIFLSIIQKNDKIYNFSKAFPWLRHY